MSRLCDECGFPVPPREEWSQPVEGGAGRARGHRSCIEAEWGPTLRTPAELAVGIAEARGVLSEGDKAVATWIGMFGCTPEGSAHAIADRMDRVHRDQMRVWAEREAERDR